MNGFARMHGKRMHGKPAPIMVRPSEAKDTACAGAAFGPGPSQGTAVARASPGPRHRHEGFTARP
jgi:hypothetical protein